jgi:hypothetical protein
MEHRRRTADVPAMIISTASLRTLGGALGLALLSTACIITTNEDDDGGPGSSADDDPLPTTGQPSSSTGPVADDTGTDTGDPTTSGPMGDCSDNLVLDPGFEGGSPSEAWAEASEQFETPICDAGCTTEEGAVPYAGDWWGWFGGIEDEPEAASLAQTITIDPEMAYLRFWFQIRSGAGMGNDVFTVTLAGDTVFIVTDLEMANYDAYTQVDIDVSAWADGGSYELRFASEHTGVGLTSFFLDEVSLVSCVETGSTDSTGPDTEGQDSTGGSTSDTDGTTSGSSSDGSSSSTDDGTTTTGASSSSG